MTEPERRPDPIDSLHQHSRDGKVRVYSVPTSAHTPAQQRERARAVCCCNVALPPSGGPERRKGARGSGQSCAESDTHSSSSSTHTRLAKPCCDIFALSPERRDDSGRRAGSEGTLDVAWTSVQHHSSLRVRAFTRASSKTNAIKGSMFCSKHSTHGGVCNVCACS